MHTLTIDIDNSIYKNFISMLAMLPEEKIRVIHNSFSPFAISDKEAKIKVQRAIDSQIEYSEDDVFVILENELNENYL